MRYADIVHHHVHCVGVCFFANCVPLDLKAEDATFPTQIRMSDIKIFNENGFPGSDSSEKSH